VIEAQRIAIPARFVAAIVLVVAPGVFAADDAPMRNEDVVRMLVAGIDASQIVAQIRSRPVEFDLSEEMVEELRIAGVPDEVLRAMEERHAELHPEARPVPDEPSVPETPLLVIEIEGSPSEAESPERPAVLYFPALLPAPAAQALQIGDGSKDLPVKAIAIFLACRTAIHVPDYWRSESPLGRDFVSMPRHGMVAFHGGGEKVSAADVPAGASKRLRRSTDDAGYLRLELPDRLEAQIDLSEPHDFSFGVAIQVEDRFLRITTDDRDAFVIGDDRVVRVRVFNDSTEDTFGIRAVFID